MSDKNKIIGSAALVLGIILIFIFASSQFSKSVKYYPVTANITGPQDKNVSLGISVDQGKIDFGSVPINAVTTVQKSIFIKNHGDQPVQITIQKLGNISNYLTVEKDSFALSGGETKNVTVTLASDQIKDPVYLSGKLMVERQTEIL